MPVERDDSVIEICRQAVDRLSERLPDAQLSCHIRVADSLRVVATAGSLRVIYEVRRSQGGVCWRAVETGKPQLVPEVRRDPDYLATDARVRSEIAVPVAVDGAVFAVLDAEFLERAFEEEEAEAVAAEAARLEHELARVGSANV
jgi:putative methionine-R-sulfoxide reductase with GAF domain